MGTLLKLEHLCIERGERILVTDLNDSIQAGQITVVLGPNGAGKSSLLLAMAGLIPYTGDIMLCGKPLAAYDRWTLSRRIAWQGTLPPTEFGLTVRQRLQLVTDEDVETCAREMDVHQLLERPLGRLSSGERQRVELVALLLREAPLWLLDEPMAHLDLKHQIACVGMLKAQASGGRAIVTVVHDLQQARALADRLILLDGVGGAVCGSVDEVFERQRLTMLFDSPLQQCGTWLMPDYGEVDEIT